MIAFADIIQQLLKYMWGPMLAHHFPICGMKLTLDRPGVIKVGDPVYAVPWGKNKCKAWTYPADYFV